MSVWNEEKTVEVYSIGLCAATACAPRTMPADEVARICNEIVPTGIISDWKISEDTTFRTGELHPCVCESDALKQHWLMVC